MANIFEYIISIKDRASAAAQKIAGATGGINSGMQEVIASAAEVQNKATNAFSRLAARAKDAVSGPKFLTKSIDELEDQLQEVNKVRFGTVLKSEFKEATREAEKLEKQINRLKQGISGGGLGSKIAGWRSDFASSLPGANLIKNPLVAAGAMVGGFWGATQKAMDAGKEKMKLQVLTGSEEIGGALYDGLTKFATDTVFGSELYDYGVQMLSNGINQADVLPVMKELGDIAMGDAGKLGQLSLAFAQINGKGKLAGQELLQLINAGFNPLQVLTEATGESMESLQARMSKGQLGIDEVRKAMQIATGPGGKFHEMLDKVAKTPYGQLEGLKGQLDQLFIKIGETFLPIATKLMQFFSWLGEKLGPYLQPVAAILGGLAVGLLAVAAAQWAWNLAIWSNQIGLIVAGVIALIAAIAWVVVAFDGWGKAWGNLMKGLKYTWLGFTGAFKALWLETVDKFMWGVELIEKAWYKVKSLWDEDGANAGLAKLKEDAEKRAFQIAYQNGLNKVNDNIARDAFSNIIGENGLHRNSTTFSGAANKIKGALMPGMAPHGGGGGGGADDKTKQSREAIATGGTKNTTINIQIGKQIETLTLMTGNLRESAERIRDVVVEEMTRAVAMAGALAG